jgi:hypothetical protein
LLVNGGGEPARECAFVEVMDMLSDMDTSSLDGVPGKLIEVTLAFLRACLFASILGRVGAMVGTGGIISSFGV